jgi:hypothetical protein
MTQKVEAPPSAGLVQKHNIACSVSTKPIQAVPKILNLTLPQIDTYLSGLYSKVYTAAKGGWSIDSAAHGQFSEKLTSAAAEMAQNKDSKTKALAATTGELLVQAHQQIKAVIGKSSDVQDPTMVLYERYVELLKCLSTLTDYWSYTIALQKRWRVRGPLSPSQEKQLAADWQGLPVHGASQVIVTASGLMIGTIKGVWK